MSTSNLENEIAETSERIENRQSEIENDLSKLAEKISFYTKCAWVSVWTGVLVAIIAVIIYLSKPPTDDFGLNLLGDFMAGSVASIWSLAGLFFIYVAFLGQKQQLLHQQLEIMYSQLEVKYTRLELFGQKAEMIAQNNTLRVQKFENTFFQLLTLFNSIVNSLDLRNRKTGAVTTTGRDCFEAFYKKLSTSIIVETRKSDVVFTGDFSVVPICNIINAYEEFYNNNKSDVSHYFRTLYHIIKFIDKSDVENKKQYTAIVRAQLSSYEQILIFYNCLHSNGRDKFKPLIERYSMFKTLDESLLFNEEHLEEYYQSAFG
jgi:hypothetical protein